MFVFFIFKASLRDVRAPAALPLNAPSAHVMWYAQAAGSVFSSLATPLPAADREPRSPFPEPIAAAAFGRLDSDASVLAQLQTSMREDARTWHTLAARAHLVPHTGSLAHQCIVIILQDGSFATVPSAAFDAALMHRLCTTFHLRAKVAQRVANGLLAYVHSVNERARATLRNDSEQPAVLRIAIKHIASLEYNATTQTCWFGNGHANVLVAHIKRQIAVLIEPSGASNVPTLVEFLRTNALPALRHTLVLHNLHMPTRLPADRLCTLWCAVYAALLLHNWPVHEPEWFWRVVHWAAAKRPTLMHAFLAFATAGIKLK